MVKTISSPTDLEMEFKQKDRDCFSYEGYDALLQIYDDIDPDMELDVISICTEWTEYGPEVNGDYDLLIEAYGSHYDFEEWAEDNDIDPDEGMEDESIVREYITDLCSMIEGAHDVIELYNDDYLISN